jgi:hypothetical protein
LEDRIYFILSFIGLAGCSSFSYSISLFYFGE